MRLGAIPETFVERVLLLAGLAPTPLLDTFQSIVLARAIMTATKLGVFEALERQPLSALQTAEAIEADPSALEKLLNGLASAGYLRHRSSSYSLTRTARKWLLKSSPKSLHDNILHRYLEWEAIERFDNFVETGTPLDVHDRLQPSDWSTYQKGMRSLAGLSADEVARRSPLPRDLRDMLDLGGSHGYYSATLCRRYPRLKSTIIDLPEAVRHASPILARENLGDRVGFRAEDVLEADFGEEQVDFILVSQLLHHFDQSTNRELIKKASRSLRPGGILAVLEILKPVSPGSSGQTGALLDLYFAAISRSGSWSPQELSSWQKEAGLFPLAPVFLRSLPGGGIQAAVKGAKDFDEES